MHGWVARWLLNVIALIFTASILSGFHLTLWGALVGSVFLGIVNAIIRPVMVILTLPLTIVTLGLFTFVINGIMLYLTSATIKGFEIQSFGWAVIGAFVYSVLSFLVSYLIKDRR